jgi:hypothetical protein
VGPHLPQSQPMSWEGAARASLRKGKGQASVGKQLLGAGADSQPSFHTKAPSCHRPVWSLDFPAEFVEGTFLLTHPDPLTDGLAYFSGWETHSSPALFLSSPPGSAFHAVEEVMW